MHGMPVVIHIISYLHASALNLNGTWLQGMHTLHPIIMVSVAYSSSPHIRPPQ